MRRTDLGTMLRGSLSRNYREYTTDHERGGYVCVE